MCGKRYPHICLPSLSLPTVLNSLRVKGKIKISFYLLEKGNVIQGHVTVYKLEQEDLED
jgi:hypothetical protein